MDLSLFIDDVPFNHQQCVLDNLTYEAALKSKVKELDVMYDSTTYRFVQEEKILRKDLLEITYRFVK